MKFITHESLERPEVLRWQERMLERYTPPKGIKVAIFLPCSAKKPYSKSKSHMTFRHYIKKGVGKKIGLVHELILTSPLGLVPRELENVYPAAHYDIPVTGHWSKKEKEVVAMLVRDYLKKSNALAIGHVNGVCREICEELGIETNECVLSKKSLNELSQKISKIVKKFENPKIDRKLENLKKICDFQFGLGLGEHLMKNAKVKGRAIFGKKQIACITDKGLIALTLEGGKILAKSGKYTVRVSFKPDTNSIFSPGVEEADEEIRPNDEVVVVHKDEVVGVGRALLSGKEMTRAKIGLAVKLRHRL